MRAIDITGRRFGHLVAIERRASQKRSTIWLCKCDCGKTKEVRYKHLADGCTKSCGCQHYEACKTHGKTETRLYHIWRTMKARCEDANSHKYYRYGARGISVCDEWHSFQAFYDWAMAHGYSDTLSIDRIDNNGDYEPSNCRWATAKEQAKNKSTTVYVEIDGELKTLIDLAEISGIKLRTLHSRYSRGVRGMDLISPIRDPKKNLKHYKEKQESGT